MTPEGAALKAMDRAMTGASHVLEVGCGAGAMAERIAALPGVTLVAVDQSDDAVELTAARGVDARFADLCYLPFDDDSFDVALAHAVLHEVRDIDRALSEIRRVLRPGGTFVVVTDVDDDTDVRRPHHRFSGGNGERMLSRRFSDVRRQDLESDTSTATVFEAR